MRITGLRLSNYENFTSFQPFKSDMGTLFDILYMSDEDWEYDTDVYGKTKVRLI